MTAKKSFSPEGFLVLFLYWVVLPVLLNNTINTESSCRDAALVAIRKIGFLCLLHNSVGTQFVRVFSCFLGGIVCFFPQSMLSDQLLVRKQNLHWWCMVLWEVFSLSGNQIACDLPEKEHCVIIDQMTTSLAPPPQLRRVYFLQSVTRMVLAGRKKMMQ